MSNIIKNSMLIICALTTICVEAQNLEWVRKKRTDVGGNLTIAEPVHLNNGVWANNSYYFSGEYGRLVDFDLRKDSTRLSSTGSLIKFDGYIARYDSAFNPIFLKTYQTSRIANNGIEEVGYFGLYPINDGMMYATGEFTGIVDIDPGAGSVIKTGPLNLGTGLSLTNQIISLLDQNANLIWGKHIINQQDNSGYGFGKFAQNSNNKLFASGSVGGRLGDTILVDGSIPLTVSSIGSRTDSMFNSAGSYFISKINSTGAFEYAKKIEKTSYATIDIIRISADAMDNLYIMGGYRDSVDFNPSDTIQNLAIDTNQNLMHDRNYFLAKYDSLGNFLWLHDFQPQNITGQWFLMEDAQADDAGNIYVTGTFGESPFDFDFDSTAYQTLSFPTNIPAPYDVYPSFTGFLAKYAPDGGLVWLKKPNFQYQSWGVKLYFNPEKELIWEYTHPLPSARPLPTTNFISSTQVFAKIDPLTGNEISRVGALDSMILSPIFLPNNELTLYGYYSSNYGFWNFDLDFAPNSAYIMPYDTSYMVVAHYGRFGLGTNPVQNAVLGNFSLYPNPANTLTNIQFLGDDAFSAAQVAVYDISGKEIINTTMTDKLLQLKTEAFAAGIYTVQITTKTSVQHQKLVIER